MSGWELFTWINVWILGLAPILVFVLVMRELPALLKRASQPEDDEPAE